MSGDDLLDFATLETLAMLGERRGRDLLTQLVGLFREQGPKAFASMRGALADQDATALRETAHSLKGSYRSLGTKRLAEISTELERCGQEGRFDGVEAMLDEIETTFTATERALQDFIAQRRGGGGG